MDNDIFKVIVNQNYIDVNGQYVEKESAFKALHPGDIIKTQVNFSKAWESNIVLFTEGALITVSFIDKYAKERVLENDLIKISFGIDNGAVCFLCVVKQILTGSTFPMMTVKVIKTDNQVYQRSSIRYEIEQLCSIRAQNRDSTGYIIDISEDGAGIITKEQLFNDAEFNLSFNLYEEVSLISKIVTIKDKYVQDNKIEYGVRFTQLSQVDKKNLDKILMILKNLEEESVKDLRTKYFPGRYT